MTSLEQASKVKNAANEHIGRAWNSRCASEMHDCARSMLAAIRYLNTLLMHAVDEPRWRLPIVQTSVDATSQ